MHHKPQGVPDNHPNPGKPALNGGSPNRDVSVGDFPFYHGQPVTLNSGQWLLVLAAVALGFACITAPIPVLISPAGIVIRTVLFAVVPLVALRCVAGPHWKALFRRVRGVDIGWMVAFAILNLIVSSLVGILVMKLFGADVNVAVGGLANQAVADQMVFFLRSVPQLLGEEILTILPFLAILFWMHNRLGLSRGISVLIAWVVSAVIFGLAHLPSYNWNWLQCILVIGSARLVLTLAYIKTRNLWVSTGAHIINDWAIFGVVIIASVPGFSQAGP